MILIRFVLVSLIIYLIIRAFANYGKEERLSSTDSQPKNNDSVIKKVSKKIGEYVDYEELDK